MSGVLIVDGHEDLSMAALADGRDYLGSARAVREVELAAGFESDNGVCMLGLAEWLRARVGVIVATVATIPRSLANHGELSYATVQGAHQQALAHIDLYRRWERSCGAIRVVTDRRGLEEVVSVWDDEQARESDRWVGLVLLMENADPIRTPAEVSFWVEQGIRLVGPAWHANRYSGDTRAGGPLTPLGRELLVEMGRAGLVLDLTHMSEEACLEALETYAGPIVATHAHARRTVKGASRLLSDEVVHGIVARGGIVGVLPLNWALRARSESASSDAAVSLDAVVDAIDTICQIAGDAQHVGIGTDFDGGQGSEETPAELDTIADLPKLSMALAGRGYTDEDVAGIMGRNWLAFLSNHLPGVPSSG
jgi:membrane dipeptidase